MKFINTADFRTTGIILTMVYTCTLKWIQRKENDHVIQEILPLTQDIHSFAAYQKFCSGTEFFFRSSSTPQGGTTVSDALHDGGCQRTSLKKNPGISQIGK